MPEPYEWIKSFETVIYSRGDQPYRNRLYSAITIKDGESIICLRNIDGDKVGGFLKFSINRDVEYTSEIEKEADSLYEKFEHSMLLQGFILRETKLGKLKCINPQGKMLTTSTTYDIRYTIEGTTKPIPENIMLQVNEIFREIGSNRKLSKIACDIKKREGLDRDVGHFISY